VPAGRGEKPGAREARWPNATRAGDVAVTDIFETIERWRAEGQRIALATVVAVERSAPRDPGAILAVCERGEVAGSVSGGCVEAAVYEEARDAIETGRPRLVTYGISDRDAVAVGLTCGGTIHVFVERLDDWATASGPAPSLFDRLSAALKGETPVALTTRLGKEGVGAKLLVSRTAHEGTLGARELDEAVVVEARAMLAFGGTQSRSFGPDGEPIGTEVQVFIQSFAPKPAMYVFGAIDFSRAMATMGRYLGYRVVVVDARPVFATKARIPDADQVAVAWPHEYLAAAHVDEATALIVLTHDVKFDVPLLLVALRTNAGYIGVMGSRRTHAARIAQLRAAGVTDSDLARINAPVGLDIGARTPEETAVSIAAELIAVRAGRTGGRLALGSEPIHGSPVRAAG
jgi:xanthine dehydrogenase accessory factor